MLSYIIYFFKIKINFFLNQWIYVGYSKVSIFLQKTRIDMKPFIICPVELAFWFFYFCFSNN